MLGASIQGSKQKVAKPAWKAGFEATPKRGKSEYWCALGAAEGTELKQMMPDITSSAPPKRDIRWLISLSDTSRIPRQ
jgi:hypothetical protein